MASPLSNSPFGNLPAELLERILLQVVNGGAFATETALCNKDALFTSSDTQTVSMDLAFRGICTTFRDLSWRALGKKIEQTVFDLASRISIENLGAIARKPDLAPWITQLNFACHATYADYPFPGGHNPAVAGDSSSLSGRAREETLQIKKDEQEWYPDTWSLWAERMKHRWSGEYLDPNLDRHQTRDDQFEKALAKDLASFKNIHGLRYLYEDTTIPGRYRNLVKLEANEKFRRAMSKDFESTGSPLYAHLGLDVLVTACALSHTRPRVLYLAVDLDEQHAFITSVPKEILSAVCDRVEDLHLFYRYAPFSDGEDTQIQLPRICITKEIFPTLRSLELNYIRRKGSSYLPVVSLPSPADVPTITHLTIDGAFQAEPTLLAFVACYGKHLQSVTLKGVVTESYDDMLNVLRQADLRKLKIIHMRDSYWDRHRERCRYHERCRHVDCEFIYDEIEELLQGLQKHRIKGVADEITLEPEGLVMAIEDFRVRQDRDESLSGDEE